MNQVLEFERPIVHLKQKIAELKEISSDSEIDLSQEIETLENKLKKLEDDVYSNLKPWNRVQMARHQMRPTTLDYIKQLFTEFIEFHGEDRKSTRLNSSHVAISYA